MRQNGDQLQRNKPGEGGKDLEKDRRGIADGLMHGLEPGAVPGAGGGEKLDTVFLSHMAPPLLWQVTAPSTPPRRFAAWKHEGKTGKCDM